SISSEGRYDHFDTSPYIFQVGFPTKKQLKNVWIAAEFAGLFLRDCGGTSAFVVDVTAKVL
ncbi:MAG: hypothetical protein RR978_03230, partial [Oscillospiraceae bacterium]